MSNAMILDLARKLEAAGAFAIGSPIVTFETTEDGRLIARAEQPMKSQVQALIEALTAERAENKRLRDGVERVTSSLGDEPYLTHGHGLDAWRELTDLLRINRDGDR